MPRVVPVPGELLLRPFTVAEASDLGVPRGVVDGPRFRRPHRGVRVARSLPDSVALRAVCASLALPRRAALTGWTVVALLQLPTPLLRRHPLQAVICARVPAGPADSPLAVPVVDGLSCGAGLRPARVTLYSGDDVLPYLPPGSRGLRIQRAEDAWAELAPGLLPADAVALGDAVRRHFAGEAELDDAVAQRAGLPGVVALREVRVAVRWRVDSAMESLTRRLLVGAGVPEPECGYTVEDGGVWLALVDMCWPRWLVIVEYDGDGHRTGDFTDGSVAPGEEAAVQRRARERWQTDTRRREQLRAAG